MEKNNTFTKRIKNKSIVRTPTLTAKCYVKVAGRGARACLHIFSNSFAHIQCRAGMAQLLNGFTLLLAKKSSLGDSCALQQGWTFLLKAVVTTSFSPSETLKDEIFKYE